MSFLGLSTPDNAPEQAHSSPLENRPLEYSVNRKSRVTSEDSRPATCELAQSESQNRLGDER